MNRITDYSDKTDHEYIGKEPNILSVPVLYKKPMTIRSCLLIFILSESILHTHTKKLMTTGLSLQEKIYDDKLIKFDCSQDSSSKKKERNCIKRLVYITKQKYNTHPEELILGYTSLSRFTQTMLPKSSSCFFFVKMITRKHNHSSFSSSFALVAEALLLWLRQRLPSRSAKPQHFLLYTNLNQKTCKIESCGSCVYLLRL